MANRTARNAARKPAMAERRARQHAREVGLTPTSTYGAHPVTGLIGKYTQAPVRVRKLA